MLIGPLLFLLAGLLVILSAAAVVARLRLASLPDRLIGFGTLAVAQIELSLLISGALFDSLRRPTLLAVNAVVTASALLYGGRDLLASRRELHVPERTQLGRVVPWVAILLVVAAAEVVWRTFSAAVLPPDRSE